jgi:large subunit ribosomal protein L35
VTGTGKIVRHQAFARHILTKKTRSRKRHLSKSVAVSDGDTPKVRQMLPYA